jgi:hypothetical protein
VNAVELIRSEMKTAHDWFEGTMADVTPEQANWQPPGVAHPIGALYAHTVAAEDMMVNGLLKGGAPLFATTWAGKTGISGDPQLATQMTPEWSRSVNVDLPTAREYAAAVYAATDDYLGGMDAADLDRAVDLSDWGMGEWSEGSFLISIVLAHVHDLMGEVSALKGVQGAKGYPF